MTEEKQEARLPPDPQTATVSQVVEVPPPPQSVVTEANEAAARLEKATAELNKTIQRQEALKVNEMLGGQSEATPSKVKKETPEEYADRVMRGDYEKAE